MPWSPANYLDNNLVQLHVHDIVNKSLIGPRVTENRDQIHVAVQNDKNRSLKVHGVGIRKEVVPAVHDMIPQAAVQLLGQHLCCPTPRAPNNWNDA